MVPSTSITLFILQCLLTIVPTKSAFTIVFTQADARIMARSSENFALSCTLARNDTKTSHQAAEVLDKSLVTYLKLLDQYTNEYDQLRSQIQTAFFNLTKSKFILGPTRIGSDSYDLASRLPIKTIFSKPQALIDLTEHREELEIQGPGPFTLEINRHEYHPLAGGPKSASDSMYKAFESTLRKRRTKNESVSKQASLSIDGTEKVHQTNSGDDEEIVDHPRELPDPILQFSALPPPSLRAAQAGFSRSLESMVKLANLRFTLSEVEKVIARYKELINSDLKANSGKANSDP